MHLALDKPAACLQCHEPRKATTAQRCLACHTELGARIQAGTGYHGLLDVAKRSECGTCHADHGGREADLVTWTGKRESFDHLLAGFRLEGKHATLACDQCHKPDLVRAADVREEQHVKLAHTYLGLSRRCAECHADAHHGQFARQLEKGDCSSCHGQTTWKPAKFDHARARYPLEGQHRELACAKCHFSVNAANARVAAVTPGSFVRYRPLDSSSCTACHQDPHHDRYGQDCARCHSTAGWKSISLATFDHGRTRYPLTGKHTSLECAKCHWSENLAGARLKAGTPGAFVHYKPLQFQACTACHQDPHKNRYGQDCARCHSTAAWTAIASAAFDHDKTDYPLRGLHRAVECVKCHQGGDFKKPLAFQRCRDCHADAHGGQLSQRTDGGACESCHGVEAYKPARFGVAEHQQTRFPLRDAHLAVACNACHKPTAAGAPRGSVQFRFANQACTACHADPHAAQFAAKGGVTDCARCHGVATWKLSPFDHDKTQFKLEGAHARTACASCHKTETVATQRVVRYRPVDTSCRSCHSEPMLREKRLK